MIKSMTGFGKGESEDNIRHFSVEIKSVNTRYNDIIIKMPKHLTQFEDSIRKLIKSKVNRGRLDVYISLEYIGDSGVDVKVNLPLATSYKKAVENLCDELNINDKVSIDLLTRFPDIITIEKKEDNEDEVWKTLKEAIEIAMEKLIIMRINEGEELAKDIRERAYKIKERVKDIEKRSPEIVVEYKEKLWNRIDELLEDKYELDENRLMNEVAIFADRYDINEEIVRLYSHIDQLLNTLKIDGPVGRKLDFIIQEMNRETNTIGSKVGDIAITNHVIEMKSELEKIKEQIQNIE